MITKDQALQHREFHFTGRAACSFRAGERGGEHLTVMVVRASGRCQTWVRSPQRFRLPIKYGLYSSGEITNSNAADFHTIESCPALLAMEQHRINVERWL